MGDKLRQMVEALLHGRDCVRVLFGLTELRSAAGMTDRRWPQPRICPLWARVWLAAAANALRISSPNRMSGSSRWRTCT